MKSLASFFLAFIATAAGAEGIDGNALLQSCNAAIRVFDGVKLAEVDRFGLGLCTGFVAGYLEGNEMGVRGKRSNDEVFCPPVGGVNGSQAVRVFVKYMRENPTELHRPGGEVLFYALAVSFPCKVAR